MLSQDEARFPMVPTLQRTLGVKGHRPTVGTWDNKDMIYVFGAVDLVSGRLLATTLERPQNLKKLTGMNKIQLMQKAFADFIHHVGRHYPQHEHPRVVITIDNANWHGGAPVREALSENPHIELYRLPAYSPELNPIERFWRSLRRRASHNRLFETMKQLKSSLRNSLRYFQTVTSRMVSLIATPYPTYQLAS